ncbi:MAG TPA: DUF6132 family protein [Prolixibacteraceae bacterium]|nr:DUF6132 family protein [Prolixibacteraceae bacterium]
MLDFILKYKRYFIGIALGAVAGFLYWHFVGCSSGTCPITSRWYNSTIYGVLIGALFANTKKKPNKKEVKPENNNES